MVFLILILGVMQSPSYHLVKIKKGDTFYKLFEKDWQLIARFNRLDEKHLVVGREIKVPKDLEMLRNWTPMPENHVSAMSYDKYILIKLGEQFLGFYKNGKLIFDAPISSGRSPDRCDSPIGNCSTPIGFSFVLGGDKNHVSSIYNDSTGAPYPMDWAIRFYVNKSMVQYWIHSGDLPGYPDSHGCVRLTKYDAEKLFNLVFEKYPETEFWIPKKKQQTIVEITN